MHQHLQNTSSRSESLKNLESPRRVRWTFSDLVSSDGHRLVATFSACLSILSEPAERRLFAETFLTDSSAASLEQIVAHFQSPLRAATERIARTASVQVAMSEESRLSWVESLKSAAKAVAFACGIELLPPFDLELSSPSLEKEQLDQMQRTIAERKTAGQVEHFSRAAELLRQWESLHAAAPSISPGRMLEQLSTTDRGAMLETLMLASANQSVQPDLWAVAGPNLVRIRFDANAPQTTLTLLPATAGPLRSVNIEAGKILVGARNGVFVLDPANLNAHELYRDGELSSEHGFSRAMFFADKLWACHRDGGIIAWNQGDFDRPAIRVRPAELGGSPKLLQLSVDENRAAFAVEERLLSIRTNGEVSELLKMSSSIVHVGEVNGRVVIVSEDGTVSMFDAKSMQKLSENRPVGRLTGASFLPWLSSARLLLTTADGPVHCVGLEDQLVTQFSGPHLGARLAKGSAGKVAAMSADRQRLVIWNSWDGRKPVSEIYITGLAKHRVADIAFA